MIILAFSSNGYSGCECEDVFTFDNNTSAQEIDEEIWQWACDNAETFSYVHFGWDAEITEEEYDEYLENHVTYSYREISYEEYIQWCHNWGYIPDSYEEMMRY